MTKQQTRILNDECERILHAQADATRYELLSNNCLENTPPIILPETNEQSIPQEFLQLLHGKVLSEEEINILCSSEYLSHIIGSSQPSYYSISNMEGFREKNINTVWLIRQLTTVCFEQAETSFQIVKKDISAIFELHEKIKCCEKVKRQRWRLPSTRKDAQDKILDFENQLRLLPPLTKLTEIATNSLHMFENLTNFTDHILRKQLNAIQELESNDIGSYHERNSQEEYLKITGSYEFRSLLPAIITAKTSNAICCAMHNSTRKYLVEKAMLQEEYPKLSKTKITTSNTPDCTFTPSDCTTICKTIMKRKREIRYENNQGELQQRCLMCSAGDNFRCTNLHVHFEDTLEFPIFPIHSFISGRASNPESSLSSTTYDYDSNLRKLHEEHAQQIKPTFFQRIMIFFKGSN
ncbi:MAG: hypothetical protein LBF02_01770 [Mycoplasmataceae bacterium]|jgi:hypothetical protein|nr:hypothetical protein [Mycoplasmataceae bacterium]